LIYWISQTLHRIAKFSVNTGYNTSRNEQMSKNIFWFFLLKG